jgi:hypothetical protein
MAPARSLKTKRPACLSRRIPGSAMLLESLGRANAVRQNMRAVGYALEPRPTNAVEDEDDDEDEYD